MIIDIYGSHPTYQSLSLPNQTQQTQRQMPTLQSQLDPKPAQPPQPRDENNQK